MKEFYRLYCDNYDWEWFEFKRQKNGLAFKYINNLSLKIYHRMFCAKHFKRIINSCLENKNIEFMSIPVSLSDLKELYDSMFSEFNFDTLEKEYINDYSKKMEPCICDEDKIYFESSSGLRIYTYLNMYFIGYKIVSLELLYKLKKGLFSYILLGKTKEYHEYENNINLRIEILNFVAAIDHIINGVNNAH